MFETWLWFEVLRLTLGQILYMIDGMEWGNASCFVSVLVISTTNTGLSSFAKGQVGL